jgi:hypothetical protein
MSINLCGDCSVSTNIVDGASHFLLFSTEYFVTSRLLSALANKPIFSSGIF